MRPAMTVTDPAVLDEAGRATSTLVTLAPSLPAWAEYHSAFIERWGPGAAVPVRHVLNVLGYPAGYRKSARRALRRSQAATGCSDTSRSNPRWKAAPRWY
jgi:Lantibiotic dehydratase, N terminus